MKSKKLVVFDASDINFKKNIKNYNFDKNALTILIVPRDKFFIKKVEIPNCNPEDLQNIISYEAEKHFFIDKEDLILQYFDSFLIAVKKEIVEEYLKLFQNLKIEISKITFRTKAFDCILDNKSIVYLFSDFAEINIFNKEGLIISRTVKQKNLDYEYDLTLKSIRQKHFEIKNYQKFYEADYLNNVNFLPQEILTFRNRKKNFKNLCKIGLMIFIVMILLIGYFLKLKSQSMQKDEFLIEKFNKLAPKILALEKMQNKIRIIENFRQNNISNLDILQSLSLNLDGNVYVREYSYSREENTINFKFRTNSYKNISLVASRLDSTKLFHNIQNKGSYMVNLGDKKLVDFEIECNLEQKID